MRMCIDESLIVSGEERYAFKTIKEYPSGVKSALKVTAVIIRGFFSPKRHEERHFKLQLYTVYSIISNYIQYTAMKIQNACSICLGIPIDLVFIHTCRHPFGKDCISKFSV